MQKKADSALRGADLRGIHQIAADSSCGEPPQHRLSGDQQAGAGFSHRELAQRRQSGRWPQAKALPMPGGPTAEPLPGLGSPVPSEAEMSRHHAPSGRTRQRANREHGRCEHVRLHSPLCSAPDIHDCVLLYRSCCFCRLTRALHSEVLQCAVPRSGRCGPVPFTALQSRCHS